MRDENCIFCKIAGGEIPTTTLYEDDDFRVILDVAPATKGHALILSKEHYRNLYDLDSQLAGKALILAQQMTNKLKEALGCAGFNIVQNNEAVAGQTVFHFHIHLIPRYVGDAAGISWKSGKLSEADRDEIVDLISGKDKRDNINANKTPSREIKTAQAKMKDYIERHGE